MPETTTGCQVLAGNTWEPDLNAVLTIIFGVIAFLAQVAGIYVQSQVQM